MSVMAEKEFDYMNVIPLVDVMLVLLTIVLTTSTFIATGAIKVELPGVKNKHSALQQKKVMIEISGNGQCYLDRRPVAVTEIRQLMTQKDKETPVLIRADRNLQLQKFVDVLDAVKSLGFKSVSIQTQEKS